MHKKNASTAVNGRNFSLNFKTQKGEAHPTQRTVVLETISDKPKPRGGNIFKTRKNSIAAISF